MNGVAGGLLCPPLREERPSMMSIEDNVSMIELSMECCADTFSQTDEGRRESRLGLD